MEFYQACYGKPDGIHWEVFNDTVPDALDSYKTVFSKAASYCGPDMIRSVLGGRLPQDLYELVLLNDVTCVFRAKYGNAGADADTAQDTRDVMFAHGFLFDTVNAAEHPEYVLSIRDENFRFDVSATKTQPASLSCEAALTVDTAMAKARLTKETWNTLMACIYAQRDNRSDASLFIKSSGRDQMKALIYCIFQALPKQLRFLFAFSNENSISGTMFGKNSAGDMIQPQRIFFTDVIPAQAYYFDPSTGETNYDLRDIENGVVTYPSYDAFCNYSPGVYAEYCDLLSKTMSDLGLPALASLGEIELASLFVEGSSNLEAMDEKGLWRYLLNLIKKLRESRIQTLYTDEYIANVLEICDHKGFTPNDRIMDYLNNLSARTESPRLVEIYKKLQMRILMNCGEEEIARFLEQEYKKGGEIFHGWCQRIMDLKDGNISVRKFYEKRMQATLDYQGVDNVYKDGKVHLNDTEWDNTALRQFVRLALGRMDYSNLQISDYGNEFICLQKALLKTFESLGDSAYRAAYENICDHFWWNFDIASFSFTANCIDNCRRIGEEYSTGFEPLYDIYDIVVDYQYHRMDSDTAFERIFFSIKNLEDDRNPDSFEPEELVVIYPKIQAFILNEMHRCRRTAFTKWLKLAILTGKGKNPIEVMYRWNLPVICDADLFGELLQNDEEMQEKLHEIAHWISGDRATPGALDSLSDVPDAVKTLKREAKAIADFEKKENAFAKKQEREIRKQARQLEKDRDIYSHSEHEKKSGKDHRGAFGLFRKK